MRRLEESDITYTHHTYMFNYHTGQIKPLDPDKYWSNSWRVVTSVLYPFSVYDIKKHIPNAEKVFCYNYPQSHEVFWGYVVDKLFKPVYIPPQCIGFEENKNVGTESLNIKRK